MIRAEVPGVNAEDLDITVEHGALVISGQRKRDERDGTSHYRRERPFGTFTRTIHVPDDLDGGRAVAKCHDGMLTIRIPTQEQAKPRKISIR